MQTANQITKLANGALHVPDHVEIPFIEGDGVGPDIWRASQMVFDAAVEKCFHGTKKVIWKEVLAGEKAFKQVGNWLPDETLQTIKDYRVAIKGPLTTPVGKGVRSINVALRQTLDLYACIRPVRYYPGVPSPFKEPQKVNMVIFRENTEDVYAGLEFAAGTKEAEELRATVERLSGKKVRAESAIGIKPMTSFASKRLIKMAIEHALEHKLPSLTLVHKGNIMKFTEGAFREWGYELAKEEFREKVIFEEELSSSSSNGKLIIKDRIADNMFQQVQLRPDEYSVIATTNLNGDYLSDALAAMVGGLGIAPGGNIGAEGAVFEATHGTAPKYAGQDKVNPGSVILSGKMMFDYLGWTKVGSMIDSALESTIKEKVVTYDLARGMTGAKEVSCSKFAEELIARM
ncbi:isocitrate dehydrogenase (NADP(+)) [bacterium]|nr:isocitrate dehydrogenase (NADP(+)) [bacterium]